MTNDQGDTFLLVIACLAIAGIYFLPSIIAFSRGHEYRWVIVGINATAAWTGIGWLGSFVWAAWPSEKSLADPVIGNVTGTGKRNVGDTMGAVTYGTERGYIEESKKH